MSDRELEFTEQDAVPMVQDDLVPATYSAGYLLKEGIGKGLDVESIKELIALKNREEDRASRKEFHEHFQEMQKEYPPVKKTRAVYDRDGNLMYMYAPLDDIMDIYVPILNKHGFSYRWEEKKVADGTKEITCILSGYGHEEKATVEIPIESGNKFSSNIQQRGASTSYGKRYSFNDVVGVIIAGEDDESKLNYSDGVEYAEQIKQIRDCKSMDDLKKVWEVLYSEYKDDKNGFKVLNFEKDRQKKLIQGGKNA